MVTPILCAAWTLTTELRSSTAAAVYKGTSQHIMWTGSRSTDNPTTTDRCTATSHDVCIVRCTSDTVNHCFAVEISNIPRGCVVENFGSIYYQVCLPVFPVQLAVQAPVLPGAPLVVHINALSQSPACRTSTGSRTSTGNTW